MSNAPAAKTERHTLSFSIQGPFITSLAREKVYLEGDFDYAMKLLVSCLQCDQLSEGEIKALALDIIDGKKEIQGVYPGEDYGVVDVPEEKRPPSRSIQGFIARQKEKIDSLKHQVQVLQSKLVCIAEELPDYQMRNCDATWRTQYSHDADDNSIFGTSPGLSASRISSALGLTDTDDDDDETAPHEDVVQSFLDRMRSDDAGPDYGWLMPDGTFYAADWGEHQNFAYNWLNEHDPDWFLPLAEARGQGQTEWRCASLFQDMAGDVMQDKHRAALLHNPSLGIAFVTAKHPLTKAQKEFLFDYYTKRNRSDKANELYAED